MLYNISRSNCFSSNIIFTHKYRLESGLKVQKTLQNYNYPEWGCGYHLQKWGESYLH